MQPLVIKVEDVASLEAWVYVLSESPVVLGRGEAATLRIVRPFVSQAHGTFVYDEASGRWTYADLDSASGTTAAGRRLGSEEAVPLAPDSTLVIGSLALRVLAAPPAEPPALGAESPFASASRGARGAVAAETVPLSAVAEALRRERDPGVATMPGRAPAAVAPGLQPAAVAVAAAATAASVAAPVPARSPLLPSAAPPAVAPGPLPPSAAPPEPVRSTPPPSAAPRAPTAPRVVFPSTPMPPAAAGVAPPGSRSPVEPAPRASASASASATRPSGTMYLPDSSPDTTGPRAIAGGTRLFVGAGPLGAEPGASPLPPRRTTRSRAIPAADEPAPASRGPLFAVGAIALAAIAGGVATWAIVHRPHPAPSAADPAPEIAAEPTRAPRPALAPPPPPSGAAAPPAASSSAARPATPPAPETRPAASASQRSHARPKPPAADPARPTPTAPPPRKSANGALILE